MLDVKLLRDNPELVREAVKRRGGKFPIDDLLANEQARRNLITAIETRRHEQKKASDEFGRTKGNQPAKVPHHLKALAEEIKAKEQRLRIVEAQIDTALAELPNLPHRSVPVGDAKANQIVRTVGKPGAHPFAAKTHVELAEQLHLIDFVRGAKVSGSHFPLFTGKGARFERALINWMLDVHTKEHGYTEIFPPFLVNRASMFGTGQVPKFEEDMYRLKDDELFLIPTAEVPLTNVHREEVLEAAQLPIRYAAYTACFRREAGAYGKDTRGLVRVHQFDKVELVKFTTPETSYEELETLLHDAEVILQRLGLHYRIVALATGDLGFSAAKCYDLEAWAPGLKQFLEVSSCSNFEAFQARRANIRYRHTSTKKLEFVHTLNGSGVALARTVVCLLETYQQADGHVSIPDVLRPYFDGEELL